MLSVIIVSLNTCDDTVACLRALAGLKPAPQIILVDNNSSDGTASRVRPGRSCRWQILFAGEG